MNLFPPMTISVTWLKKLSRHSRIILLASSVALPLLSHCTSGANFSHRWSGNFFYSNNCNYTPTCPHTHMSMAIMTTTNIRLLQLGWRHWCTTNHKNIATMQNTVKWCLSLAHPRNTIGVGYSGQRQLKLLKSQALRSSSTHT
jgi:hypothetical protein